MDSPPPLDGHRHHGYRDAPRHTVRIVAGWCLMSVLVLPGLAGVLVLGLPSDPCLPADDPGCGPAPTTFAAVGLVFLAGAVLCALWSVHWTTRQQRYRFNPPPGWPPVPEGWRPPRGWEPPASLPRAPEDWRFWI